MPTLSPSPPTLHLICGKIAAGKSTLTADLSRGAGTVLLSEDDWLSHLFGDEMATLADYVRYSARLRQVIGPHVTALLRAGVSVVLDFPANTVEARAWMRGLLAQTGADHALHFLDVPDAVCIARMHARNALGAHPFDVTEAQFRQITRHFAPPGPEEGFTVIHHRHGD